MRTFHPLMLLVLFVAQSSAAQAADLNGAWTIDPTACNQVFTKDNNKVAFKPDADLHAGGMIVQGKQIIGTFEKCTVKSLLGDGTDTKVVAACSDGIMVSDVAFEVKFFGDDKITLSRKGPNPVDLQYVRCAM